MARPLYAVTIWPEWVYAILHLGKDVELRTWPCWGSLVGQDIVLHAGAYVGGPGPKAQGRANVRHFIRRVQETTGQLPPVGWTREAQKLAGSFAGLATLDTPTRTSPSPWASPDGDVWAWPLRQRRALETPIPCRGAQGIWRVPDHLVAWIEATSLRAVE